MNFKTFEEQLAHFNQDSPIPQENVEYGKYLAESYGLEVSYNYLTNIKNYRSPQTAAKTPKKKQRRFRSNEPGIPPLRQGAQDVAIALIKAGKPLTVKDLANQLGKAQSGIGQVLRRLCDRKLAIVTPRWKWKFFSLTEEGKKFFAEVKDA